MKVCIIQPAYSTDYSQSDALFAAELRYLRECDETMDIIVMPESCDCPALAKTKEQAEQSSEKYRDILLKSAAETAKRCHALVFLNARSKSEKGLRNTTYAFDRDGNIAGTYEKQHLTPGEVSQMQLDSDYTFAFSEPTVIEIEGIRFGFLVCYDFYFYENFANIARQNVDVIIGCSHQRSDTHQALQIMSQFLAYNTNAYVLRSSVSMDPHSDIGGGSMVVAPDGTVLCNMESRVGMETVEIDVTKKYTKPAGFGNPPAPHYAYIEQGRRPWKYRPAGSAIVCPDAVMPYPRVCAHRGFNTIAPENSLPAFGAAVALGAEKLILLTDVRGLLRDPGDEGTLLRVVELSRVPGLIKDGVIQGGMIPKVDCCVEAVRSGVKRTHILDGRIPHSILIELLSDEGIGTMLL